MNTDDSIEIYGLSVSSRIGVPDSERAEPQDLLVDLVIHPLRSFHFLPDQIEATVDYHAIVVRIEQIATVRPRNLIETLADEIADTVLREFSVARVAVTVRKFILPQTQHVAVRCVRSRST